MASSDPAIRPVEENLIYWVELVRSSGLDWVVDRPDLGVPAIVSDVPFPQFNMVAGAVPPNDDWATLVDRVTGFFIERGLPWMWWTTPSYTSPGLESSLRNLGLMAEDAPGMYVELSSWSWPETRDLEITLVRGDDAELNEVLVAGFGIPDFVREPMKGFLSVLEGNDIELVIRMDGESVGVGSGLITGETLGIYNVATLPEARGRGVGTAITAELMRRGRERGCTHAILHTSPMGRPVYERLGFREVCPTTQWVWLPPSE